MQLPVHSACFSIFAGLQLLLASAFAADQLPSDLDSDALAISELDPRIAHLVEQNTKLSTELEEVTSGLNRLHHERTLAEAVNERILADFSDAEATLKTVGRVDRGLGPLLRQHHESLPDGRYYAMRIELRAREKAELGVRRMLHRDEHRQMADTDTTIIGLLEQASTDTSPVIRNVLRKQIQQRELLLEKKLQQDEIYLHELQQLDNTERKLLTAIDNYDEFLRQHLWWMRGAEPSRLKDIQALVVSIGQWHKAFRWTDFIRSNSVRLLRSPLIWVTAIIAGIVTWKRQSLISAIEKSSKNLRKVSTDRISDTLRALAWTIIIASPLPLVLLIVSWQLTIGDEQLNFTVMPDASLLHLCGLLFILQILRWACIPSGLASAHFRWPAQELTRLRRELSRLTWIYIPSGLAIWVVYTQFSMTELSIAYRLGFLLFHIALSVSLYRLLHRKIGVLGTRFQVRSKGFLYYLYPLGFWFLVLMPPWLGIEMLAGYVHSSIVVSGMLLSTLALGIVLVLLYALARRWLLVVHRRLAYEAALERRRTKLAAREAKASGEVDETNAELILEEPEINLTELSEDARGLAGIMILFVGLLGLYFIWTPIFPALRIFETVNLWTRSMTIDGQVERVPTTLADIGRALMIVAATVILVSRLPSVLEFILLQRSNMSEGDRYTLKKLATYTLVAIGSLLALNTIGASWSQLQWLVAAMGVGIGFGLQEIVANFISGLIILFERPIRIGDVVTIDDTSGIVTKIRIRATTIRDWDRKELLVPNKDLITGRVLNWSLSDEMTRIVIMVGVAYDTDVDKALNLMKAAATEHEHALEEPAPLLSFDSFGDHALNLTMRVYVSSINHRIKTLTDLRKAINTKFREAGIEIAYPQRDVHFDTNDLLRIAIEGASPTITTSDLNTG